jgi:peroxiredoxin
MMHMKLAIRALFLLCAFGAAIFPSDLPRPAPELAIQMPSGEQIKMSRYKGKVVVLEFLSTTCPHCQRASQILNSLYKEFGPRGFQPVGAAFNPMAGMLVADYAKQFGLQFPVGSVTREQVYEYLQRSPILMLTVPQIVFIDRQGTLRIHKDSNLDTEWFREEEKNMRATLESLLKEPVSSKPAAAKPAAKAPAKKG